VETRSPISVETLDLPWISHTYVASELKMADLTKPDNLADDLSHDEETCEERTIHKKRLPTEVKILI